MFGLVPKYANVPLKSLQDIVCIFIALVRVGYGTLRFIIIHCNNSHNLCLCTKTVTFKYIVEKFLQIEFLYSDCMILYTLRYLCIW